MNLLRPALLFWVCVLALLGVATAGAQTPLEASFEFTPAEPAVNELVTLTDTTKNPTGAKLEYAWDLDADDQFDDGTSMAVTTAFTTPGAHRVTLRVKRVGTVTVTDSVVRTITVKESGTAHTPTPTATPTATATPGADGHPRAQDQPPAAGQARLPVRPDGPDPDLPRPGGAARQAQDVRRERLQGRRRPDRPLRVGPRRQRRL